MKFTIEITELDNAAFSGGEYNGPLEIELGRIISRVAEEVIDGNESGICRDFRGNKVGIYGYREEM